MAIGEADYSMTQMALGAMEEGDNINPEDYAGLLVKFEMYPVKDEEETKKQGRPIFKEIPYVDIRTPGDRGNYQFRPAAEVDLKRWPKHWQAFQERTAEPDRGTPLSQWPLLSKAQVEEMAFFHIKTVEDLANLNDAHAQNFMGIQALKTKAQAWLAQAGESAEAEKLASELEQRDEEIEQLKLKLDALTARIGELENEAEEVE